MIPRQPHTENAVPFLTCSSPNGRCLYGVLYCMLLKACSNTPDDGECLRHSHRSLISHFTPSQIFLHSTWASQPGLSQFLLSNRAFGLFDVPLTPRRKIRSGLKSIDKPFDTTPRLSVCQVLPLFVSCSKGELILK